MTSLLMSQLSFFQIDKSVVEMPSASVNDTHAASGMPLGYGIISTT